MIHFDIEWGDLRRIGDELGATEKQVKYALSRALNRTATRLRTLSTRGLKDKLDLRRVSALRNRLKSLRLRKGSVEGVQLWYGLNDMPVSWFRGTPRATADGATFRGQDFKGAFVGKSNYAKGKTIFRRKGKARLSIVEQLMPVQDPASVYIEDDVFPQLEDIFWPLFRRELEARVKFNIGEK